MSLKEKVDSEIKEAMKAKNQGALRALRAIKSAILLAETAEGRAEEPLSADEEMTLVMKQAKQRKDSIEQFRSNDREDLAAKEEEELVVIEKFLPAQLSPEELKAEVEAIIAEVGASSMADMGKVMGMATKKLAGRTDGKAISELVRSLLA